MTGIECKPYAIDTGYLFPPSLADSLGVTDEVHVFREVTEHLDISLRGITVKVTETTDGW